jgi:hypothetical protein
MLRDGRPVPVASGGKLLRRLLTPCLLYQAADRSRPIARRARFAIRESFCMRGGIPHCAGGRSASGLPASWRAAMQFAHHARTRRRRRCVRPRIPGLSPGWSGASPRVLRCPSAGFPPASRLPAGFSAFARHPLVALVRRSPVRSLRPLPGSGSPSVPLRVPFPGAISTLAPPRSGSAGVGPGRQGPRSSVLPRPPRAITTSSGRCGRGHLKAGAADQAVLSRAVG